MAVRADAHDDVDAAKHWRSTAALLRAGIESNLTMHLDGQTIYAMSSPAELILLTTDPFRIGFLYCFECPPRSSSFRGAGSATTVGTRH